MSKRSRFSKFLLSTRYSEHEIYIMDLTDERTLPLPSDDDIQRLFTMMLSNKSQYDAIKNMLLSFIGKYHHPYRFYKTSFVFYKLLDNFDRYSLTYQQTIASNSHSPQDDDEDVITVKQVFDDLIITIIEYAPVFQGILRYAKESDSSNDNQEPSQSLSTSSWSSSSDRGMDRLLTSPTAQDSDALPSGLYPPMQSDTVHAVDEEDIESNCRNTEVITESAILVDENAVKIPPPAFCKAVGQIRQVALKMNTPHLVSLSRLLLRLIFRHSRVNESSLDYNSQGLDPSAPPPQLPSSPPPSIRPKLPNQPPPRVARQKGGQEVPLTSSGTTSYSTFQTSGDDESSTYQEDVVIEIPHHGS